MTKQAFKQNVELLMVTFVILVLLILFTPIPSPMLDILLIINFSWALLMLLLTFYIDRPLSFSTFPSLLLISTLFRLALNISATRLILSNATAGRVIEAMGHFVIQNNYVMGLVVFLILIIVQYIVVTNGAQRVAEVAARFTLDSMPGKQMSIDADLNMGLITQEEAKSRRQALEKETNFYGAMDGASKFVKGDAIAGILIVLVDIIGGFIIGVIQKNMDWSQALHTYTLLTVGDGLVTQIPALIIATATGIIVTRAATDAQLGTEVARQIAAYPKSLSMVCAGLVAMLFLKGMPNIPIILLLTGLIPLTVWLLKNASVNRIDTNVNEEDTTDADQLLQMMKIPPLSIQFHPDLYVEIQPLEAALLESVQSLRQQFALDLGIILPAVAFLKDDQLSPNQYQITIQGVVCGDGQLWPSLYLAISHEDKEIDLSGIKVTDPTYGLPAVWIDTNHTGDAKTAGLTVIPSLIVLSTHLKEVIRQRGANLLSRAQTEELLNQPHLLAMKEELTAGLLTISQIQQLLQNLLKEQVSIRDMELILETLLEHVNQNKEVDSLTEKVRTKLAETICKPLLNENGLSVLTLAAHFERALQEGISENAISLEPQTTESIIHSIAKQVEAMLKDNKRPVILCSPSVRRSLRQLTERIFPQMSVLSLNEIPLNMTVEAFGVVE